MTSRSQFFAKLFKLKKQSLHLFEVVRHANSCLSAAQLKKALGSAEHLEQQYMYLLYY